MWAGARPGGQEYLGAHLCILVLNEAKASMLPTGVVHRYVYVFDVAKGDKRRVQDSFIDILLQATHIQSGLLVRPLASYDNCNMRYE